MTPPTVPPDEMPTPPLDPDTADRLLAGAIHSDDAPQGYRRVAALVAAARQPATEAEQTDPPAGLAALIVSSPDEPPTRGSRRRLATIAVAASVLVGASGAAAATNNLPTPIQRTVSSLGSHLGLSIPTPRPPARPTPDTTAPEADTELGTELDSPAGPDPGPLLGGHTSDATDLLPDAVDQVIPEPGVTTPTLPQPVDPPPGGESCSVDGTLAINGDCDAVEPPQIDQPSDAVLDPPSAPTTVRPEIPGLTTPPGATDLPDPVVP